MIGAVDVVVVGGGPAGAGIAIRLALRGFDVALIEKSAGRKDRLCGEFLSPELIQMFDELGVLDRVFAAGATTIRNLTLTSHAGSRFSTRLPHAALGLSRATMDEILIERAKEVGVKVGRGLRVSGIDGSVESGFRTSLTDAAAVHSRVVVGAFGKRSSLDGILKRAHLNERSPWVAFKSHFEGIDVGDSIELHCFPRGYCGLSMVEGGRVNACWLMNKDDLSSVGGSPSAVLQNHLAVNPALSERFATQSFADKTFLSAGQLTFKARGCFHGEIILVGDAAGMISPLCGDGIAMASESARILANSLSRFLARERSFDWMRATYSEQWDRAFGLRLRVGESLQRIVLAENGARNLIRLARAYPQLGAAAIHLTRSEII